MMRWCTAVVLSAFLRSPVLSYTPPERLQVPGKQSSTFESSLLQTETFL